MNSEVKKWKPHRLEIPQIKPQIQVEQIAPTNRYLWRLQNDPAWNPGDYYFNTWSSDVRFLLENGQRYWVT